MKARIARRVMVAVGVVSLASFGASAWLASRAHERELASLVERQALILSDTIRNSTRHAMLLNEREMVHRIIEQIGRQGGLEKVRVYNKEGEVIYSPDAALIGTTVNQQNEACDGCHSDGGSVAELSAGRRTRVFRGDSGERQLGVITPIANEPVCANAGCHAHPPQQQVLGVLDLTVSLADVDRTVAASRRSALLFALAGVAVISVLLSTLFHRWVGKPGAGPPRRDPAHRRRRPRPSPRRSPRRRARPARGVVQPDDREARRGAQHGLPVEQARLGRPPRRRHRARDQQSPDRRPDLLELPAEARHRRGLEERPRDHRARDQTLPRHRARPPRLLAAGAAEKTQVDLNAIVERALAIVDNQLKVQNIQLTKSLAKNLPAFPADANQLQQVVLNLLVNAADAFELGDRQIYVATDVKEVAGRAMAEIKVADNGTGIPEKNLGRIFEPFFTTKENRGTGLGLSVCWGIVTEHGGTIEVDSKVGRGTTFTVRMPLAPPPAPAPGPTPSAATLPPAERPS
jgi:two-component system NtrC family sensor kinase